MGISEAIERVESIVAYLERLDIDLNAVKQGQEWKVADDVNSSAGEQVSQAIENAIQLLGILVVIRND